MDIKELNKEQRLEVFLSVLDREELDKDIIRQLFNKHGLDSLAVIDKTERCEIIFESDLADIYQLSDSTLKQYLQNLFPNIITDKKPIVEGKWYTLDGDKLVKVNSVTETHYFTNVIHSRGSWHKDVNYIKDNILIKANKATIENYIRKAIEYNFGSNWQELDFYSLDKSCERKEGYYEDIDTYVTKKGVLYQNGNFASKNTIESYNWYKIITNDDSVKYIYYVENSSSLSGIVNGEWVEDCISEHDFKSSEREKPEEGVIGQLLLNIAEQKGFTEGIQFNSLVDSVSINTVRNGVFVSVHNREDIRLIDNSEETGNYIFFQGSWAEIKKEGVTTESVTTESDTHHYPEANQWYRPKDDPEEIKIFIKDWNNTRDNHGFLRKGEWFINSNHGWTYTISPQDWERVPSEEVKEALIKEVKKRNYTEEGLVNRFGREAYHEDVNRWYFNGRCLFSAPVGGGGYTIFDNFTGEWKDI